MKRFLSFILLMTAIPLFATETGTDTSSEKSRLFFFSGAVGTGTVIYGSKIQSDYIKSIQAEGYSRILLTSDASFGIASDEHVRFSVGIATACDFFTKSGGSYSNFVDYAFFSGVRLYPSSTGFNFAVEYAVGRRSNFIAAEKNSAASSFSNGITHTQWGNGFRFLIEYDFRHNRVGFAPVISMNWRHMPRGGSSDDILSLGFRFSFR